jgi:hypothetical protein
MTSPQNVNIGQCKGGGGGNNQEKVFANENDLIAYGLSGRKML